MGIDITRIHLEEDTAKLVHKDANSLIDFNRSGVPLMELVTEPDFKDIETTISFLKEIQLIVRHLNISTGDLEKGSMRLEANISVRLKGTKSLPTYKVELKNINSFKFLYKALQAEIKRQIQLLSKGITPTQETRGFNQTSGKTFSQRTKEEAQDYRYFPEPDIPTLFLSEKLITSLKKNLPLLPEKIRSNFMTDFNLPQNYIETLLKEPQRTIFFQKAAALATSHKISPLEIAKVMVNQSLDKKFDQPESLVKKLLSLQNRSTSSQEEVDQAAKKVLSQNKKAVEDFQKGQTQVVGFLIGQIQKILKGKGDPKLIRNTLISLLQK
jgi:aspartyl-tRNA(Asn)/glutamyl-tRNA(Gln) amidotransferase subunit B